MEDLYEELEEVLCSLDYDEDTLEYLDDLYTALIEEEEVDDVSEEVMTIAAETYEDLAPIIDELNFALPCFKRLGDDYTFTSTKLKLKVWVDEDIRYKMITNTETNMEYAHEVYSRLI